MVRKSLFTPPKRPYLFREEPILDILHCPACSRATRTDELCQVCLSTTYRQYSETLIGERHFWQMRRYVSLRYLIRICADNIVEW